MFDIALAGNPGVERWTARRLVADHYRDRDVFLARDAAHI
jgi:hypothetical protein